MALRFFEVQKLFIIDNFFKQNWPNLRKLDQKVKLLFRFEI